MTASLRMAIFDVDGTLVDSQHNIVAAMEMAHVAHGLATPPSDAIRRIIGLSLVEAVARLLPEQDDALHRQVAEAYKDAFFTLRARADHTEPLYPGVEDALAAFEAAGWLLGIATGKSDRGLHAMLERHSFQGRFVTLQTADNNPGKPHPGMILRALAETGVEAAAAVMIGDTVYDMTMAQSAKVPAVGVAWGYHPPEELLAAGAEAVVNSYDRLPSVVLALGALA